MTVGWRAPFMISKLSHLHATTGLGNQRNRFRTQDLLPRRKPHHSIRRCGFWEALFYSLFRFYEVTELSPLLIYSHLV